MQPETLQQPAKHFCQAKTFEYLLVVNPPKAINEQVSEEKENFFSAYDQVVAKTTKPHITVANFLAKEEMEETLIRYIHKVVSQKKAFGVLLNNFSGFPNHTVFIRIHRHGPFKQLAAELSFLDHYLQSNGFPEAHLATYPYMTIAKRLPEDVYRRAMLDYSQKLFNAYFMADELVLLKRQNQFDTCKKVSVFKLQPAGPLPESTEVMFRFEERRNLQMIQSNMLFG